VLLCALFFIFAKWVIFKMISHTDTDEQIETLTTPPSSKMFSSFVTEVKLNYKTIFNACVNAIGTLISTTYWIAQMTDDIADLDGEGADEYFADMSAVGLPVGVVLGFFVTIGSVYAHYILNTNSTHEIKHKNYLIHSDDDDPRIALSILQKILLGLDFLSHAADSAGPALLIISVGANDPSRLTKILAQTISSLIGCYSATTDAITCGHNIRIHNKNVILDALTPEETPASMQAQFYQQEAVQLARLYSSNPRAVFWFNKLKAVCEEAAIDLQTEEQTIKRPESIEEFRLHRRLPHKRLQPAEQEADPQAYHLLVPKDDDDTPSASRVSLTPKR
jgi:hypothetical protein